MWTGCLCSCYAAPDSIQLNGDTRVCEISWGVGVGIGAADLLLAGSRLPFESDMHMNNGNFGVAGAGGTGCIRLALSITYSNVYLHTSAPIALVCVLICVRKVRASVFVCVSVLFTIWSGIDMSNLFSI